MNSLKNHVDSIFSKYKENEQIKELKYEVLSNLEAKVDVLTGSGMELSQAINKAKESINSIDYLIDGNRQEVLRSDVEKWYGQDLSGLLKKEQWKNKVQDKLEDNQYLNNCTKVLFLQE